MADGILSKDEIKNNLKSILEDMGYEGEILNILVNLSTETVYLTQLGSAVILREGNVQTATKLESLLAISHENFTRVHRGSCQRLKVKGLQCIRTTQTKAFDLLQTKGPHKIYYYENGDYNANENDINMTLIVAKDLESYDNESGVDKRLSSDSHIMEIPGSKWSEDFLLFRNDQKIYNVEDIPVDLHSEDKYYGNMYTTEAKRVGDTVPYYIATTAPSYGIRIYNYLKFNLSDKYTFKGLRLLDPGKNDLDPKNLTEIENFLHKDNKPNIENIPSIREESSVSTIRANILANYRDRNYISSKNGVISAIKKYLGETFLGFTVNIFNGEIIVTYILNESKEWNSTIEKNFSDYALFNYKITEPIKFEQAEEISVGLRIKIFYNNVINQMEVLKLINSFEYQVGGVYKVDKVKATISKLETVAYVELLNDMESKDMEVLLEEDVIEEDNNGDKVTLKKLRRLKFDPEKKLIEFSSTMTEML